MVASRPVPVLAAAVVTARVVASGAVLLLLLLARQIAAVTPCHRPTRPVDAVAARRPLPVARKGVESSVAARALASA